MGAFDPEALVPLNPSTIERMQTSAAGPMNGYEQRPAQAGPRGDVRTRRLADLILLAVNVG
jgi:hypothetical protein